MEGPGVLCFEMPLVAWCGRQSQSQSCRPPLAGRIVTHGSTWLVPDHQRRGRTELTTRLLPYGNGILHFDSWAGNRPVGSRSPASEMYPPTRRRMILVGGLHMSATKS